MEKNGISDELVIRIGRKVIKKVMIKADDVVLTIGRHYSNDICLVDDPKVSRVHAVIVRFDPQKKDSKPDDLAREMPAYFIRDLGSTHGTKIAGTFIHKRLLNYGDEIRISDYVISFRQEGSADDEILGLPLDLLFGKLKDHKDFNRKTDLRAGKKGTADLFTREQQEFLSNMARGGLTADFSDRPEAFMNHLFDVMKAEKGLIGFYENGKTYVDYQRGFDRESPHCSKEFIENLREKGPVRQEGALWLPLPENGILALFRTRPPAFEEKDLEFARCVCEHLFTTEGCADELYELSPWPTPIVGLSDLKKECLNIAAAENPESNDILILGETGTGKEVLAQYIRAHSSRKYGPFVPVNCASVPVELAYSEFFGHVKGAFTGANVSKRGYFEMANNGILFLDEIGDTPESIQVALLTAMQQREIQPLGSEERIKVDVRIVAATDREVKKSVQNGTFRRALYERFGYEKSVLPLRERLEDIPLLAYYFLDKYPGKTRAISREALECMRRYEWPGNVRKLQRVIKEAALLKKEIIFSWDLPQDIRHADDIRQHKRKIGKTLKETEKERVMEVLEETRGNKSAAARILGIARATLHNKLKEHAIRPATNLKRDTFRHFGSMAD